MEFFKRNFMGFFRKGGKVGLQLTTYKCSQEPAGTLQSSASERPRYMATAAAIHYLNMCHSGKSRSRSAKQQRLQLLPDVCHFANYERASSSHWRSGTEKPKSRPRSRRFNFLRRSRSHMPSTLYKVIPSRMIVHDNVAVIVSEI